jgi:hypothetical protein
MGFHAQVDDNQVGVVGEIDGDALYLLCHILHLKTLTPATMSTASHLIARSRL